ncbi:RNA polymerase subunit sigma-70 [Aeromicrobium sp. Root236]|uniref:sigma-70 family RNA polymerase sigma factor n=1 Tax=Aeromicrobium sp. Root236 TaxID=1736498 RepID=UPI0006F36227|nr:sigma-70 family RNA polymerase sigma factor [Aeromicrobium sp. Root236]KRC64721.1 RNA polymerase subunit sigma-70 [Aeromicrobium sp. Root236]
MTGSTHDEPLAAAFEEQRARLVTLAHRLLGSQSDAEDAVQEAWFRLARQEAGSIDNLGGWLTTVVSRVCIDALRSRTSRPVTFFDDRLPEVVVTDPATGPEDDALLADSVGLAMLVVLDTLRPAERLAFVLHDLFAVPFTEIAAILDRTVEATRMLTSRARRKVRGAPTPDRRARTAVVDAFLAAARDGDFADLLRLLDPDVTWRHQSPDGTASLVGASDVARQAAQGASGPVVAQSVLVNGEPGVVARTPSGEPFAVMACAVVGGRIVEILSLRDPARLAAMHLPPMS